MLRSITAAILLSACASAQGDATPEPGDAGSTALAAPTPAGVAAKATAANDGQSMTVKVGGKLAVELVGTPTAGFMWVASEIPPFLQPSGEYGGPTSSAQLQPGFAGGNHWEGFVFDVTAAGEGVLKFEQRPAFAPEEPDPNGSRFSVTVIAEE
jgi:predicted secreted protein